MVDEFWKFTTAAATIVAGALGWLNTRLFGRVDKVEERVSELEKHNPTREEMNANHDRTMQELQYIRQRIDDLTDRS
jgi:predicted nuclease with TOPRIM domain